MSSIIEIPRLTENSKMIDELNALIDQFNFLQTKLSIKDNFDGQLFANLVFAAGETKTIPHKLGKIPGGRFILKQEGNGVLSDIPSAWNQYQIQMINNGAVTVTATIYLVRE